MSTELEFGGLIRLPKNPVATTTGFLLFQTPAFLLPPLLLLPVERACPSGRGEPAGCSVADLRKSAIFPTISREWSKGLSIVRGRFAECLRIRSFVISGHKASAVILRKPEVPPCLLGQGRRPGNKGSRQGSFLLNGWLDHGQRDSSPVFSRA